MSKFKNGAAATGGGLVVGTDANGNVFTGIILNVNGGKCHLHKAIVGGSQLVPGVATETLYPAVDALAAIEAVQKLPGK